jgi:hypothetical protein
MLVFPIFDSGLHVFLELDLVIIVITVFFYVGPTLWKDSSTFYRVLSRYGTILHCSMKIGKMNHFDSGYVNTWLHYSNNVEKTAYLFIL